MGVRDGNVEVGGSYQPRSVIQRVSDGCAVWVSSAPVAPPPPKKRVTAWTHPTALKRALKSAVATALRHIQLRARQQVLFPLLHEGLLGSSCFRFLHEISDFGRCHTSIWKVVRSGDF